MRVFDGVEIQWTDFDGQRKWGTGEACDKCGRQCAVNAVTVSGALPYPDLGKIEVSDLGHCDALDMALCDCCFVDDISKLD